MTDITKRVELEEDRLLILPCKSRCANYVMMFSNQEWRVSIGVLVTVWKDWFETMLFCRHPYLNGKLIPRKEDIFV